LMSRYEPPQMADSAARSPICRGVMESQCGSERPQAEMNVPPGAHKVS
jgi:hypothetical protein